MNRYEIDYGQMYKYSQISVRLDLYAKIKLAKRKFGDIGLK